MGSFTNMFAGKKAVCTFEMSLQQVVNVGRKTHVGVKHKLLFKVTKMQ